MSALRIAVLGCGFIADLHVRAAQSVGAHVAGVASHRIETARAFAARHGIPRVTTDWETLVADGSVDAVCVGTPNSLHASQTLTSLRAGKHVLVEKPMATSVADAERMADAARLHGCVLLVGHMWRYRGEVRALRARIAAGELGPVVRTHGYGVHAHWGPSGWFCDPDLSGGGALIDMGIHAIDTARFLLGDPQPVRVQASIGTGYREAPVDDDGLVLVDWAGGTRSLVEFGWWAPHLNGLEADTEVYGRDGYARIWPNAEPPGAYVHCDLPMYAAQMADFVGRCTDPEHVPPEGAPTVETGLVAQRIVEQAYAVAAGSEHERSTRQ